MPNAYVQLLVFCRHVAALAPLFVLLVLPASSARAEDYPDRPVKIIVPFAAGGTADAVPRLVGDWLSRKWGQPAGVEHRTAAAGKNGSTALSPSPPNDSHQPSSTPPPLFITPNRAP